MWCQLIFRRRTIGLSNVVRKTGKHVIRVSIRRSNKSNKSSQSHCFVYFHFEQKEKNVKPLTWRSLKRSAKQIFIKKKCKIQIAAQKNSPKQVVIENISVDSWPFLPVVWFRSSNCNYTNKRNKKNAKEFHFDCFSRCEVSERKQQSGSFSFVSST